MKIGNIIRAFSVNVLMLLGIGCMVMYMTVPDLIVSFKPSVSFEELLEEDGKKIKAGSHVEGDVVYALDYFASESTYTRRQDGSRSGSRKSGNYYLIPTNDGYMALKSRQADVEALDKLSEETFDYLMGSEKEPQTKIFVEGKAEVLEDNLVKYYQEYLEKLGFEKEEINAMGNPLVVRYVNFMAVRVMAVIGVVLLLLGVLLYRRRYRFVIQGSGLRRAEDLPNV